MRTLGNAIELCLLLGAIVQGCVSIASADTIRPEEEWKARYENNEHTDTHASFAAMMQGHYCEPFSGHHTPIETFDTTILPMSMPVQRNDSHARNSNLQRHMEESSASTSSIRNILVAEVEDQCSPPLTIETIPNSYSLLQYAEHRTKCIEECNARGYCCTNSFGGCNKTPCNEGCHFAWFSESLAQCKERCTISNEADCEYQWNHDKIGTAGFNPWWKFGVGTAKCWNALACGCPEDNFGVECSDSACETGCEIAHESALRDLFYHGEDVVIDDHVGLNEDTLLNVIQSVMKHVEGTKTLSEEKLIQKKNTFLKQSKLLDADFDSLDAAMNLVDRYEELHGPLFINSKTEGGFDRENDGDDGLELERFILVLQQAILDEVYHGTLRHDAYQIRLHDAVISNCADYLRGRSWKTADFFPGPVALPDDHDPTKEYIITIDASMPEYWGKKVCFADEPLIRLTGLYLSPGGVATVEVPSALVGQSYHVQVGASSVNNYNKNFHKRMDRVTSTYEIKKATTHVASPLGGGIYIKVPYLANDGVVTIKISGDVVEAPFISLTSLQTTTATEWNRLKESPAPWADFQTEHFIMQVPSIWVNGYSYNHLKTVLEGHEDSLVGVSELVGVPIEKRNKHVLYVQPDLHIKHGQFGVGYPQVNDLISSGPSGPKPNGPEGQSWHWMVSEPYLQNDVAWHELGHCIVRSMYRGETEAIVNFLYAYVRNVHVGEDLDTAFLGSRGDTVERGPYRFTPDRAAVDWMVTPEFRKGMEMDYSNTEKDQFRYQARGYAKYVDIVRMFGWQAFIDFNYQDNLSFQENTIVDEGLDKTDDRTLKLSIAAGVDLTPLIDFWGIAPVNEAKLKNKMIKYDLPSSNKVYSLLRMYSKMIPKDQDYFIRFFESVYPGKVGATDCPSPLYGCGWYNKWAPKYNEAIASKAVTAANAIVDKHFKDCDVCNDEPPFPTGTPTEYPTLSPTTLFCEDSMKKFNVDGVKKKLSCNDLRRSKFRGFCSDETYASMCPNACGRSSCDGPPICKDVKGKINIGDANKTKKKCSKMTKEDCALPKPMEFCPKSCNTISDSFTIDQYTEYRKQCIAECNRSGHCCTIGRGGCNRVPCATGCHIAWFSDSLEKCYEQCDIANDGNTHSCEYTWNHDQIADAGFNPSMDFGVGVPKCAGALSCGCPVNDFGLDCGSDACRTGCDMAHKLYLRCSFFHGEDVEIV